MRQGGRSSDGEGDCEERDHVDFDIVLVFCWRWMLYVEGEWEKKRLPPCFYTKIPYSVETSLMMRLEGEDGRGQTSRRARR